jgi:hypothetical protein
METCGPRVLILGSRLLEAITREGELNQAYSDDPSPSLHALMEVRHTVQQITEEYLDAVTGDGPNAFARFGVKKGGD